MDISLKTTVRDFRIGDRVIMDGFQDLSGEPARGTVASVPADFDPHVIVLLDIGQWTEGKRMYVRFIVAHPNNLIPGAENVGKE